jgi:hypothetical protein
MLQMRARSWACRDAFADALRGLAVVEDTHAAVPDEKVATAKPELVLPEDAP